MHMRVREGENISTTTSTPSYLDWNGTQRMRLDSSNGTGVKKVPVTRNSKFFDGDDFDLEMSFATEYLEQDANQTIILYRVDLSTTKTNDIYKETRKDAVRFLDPVELPVIYEITDADMRSYEPKGNKGVYAQTGKLTFSVLISTLEEFGCDISRGDYIGVQVTPVHREYFTVTDDGRVGSMSNSKSLYGTVPYARTITAVSVDPNEFRG